MSSLRVIKPGPLSLLQDAGRFGWQHLGVSPTGPMDPLAAAWANRLLGNPRQCAVLEIALGGVELEAEAALWVAITGADMPLSVDGESRLNWSRFRLEAGQRLQVGYARHGQRAYLALAGGIRAEPVLGSVACQMREGLGGLNGQGHRLVEGDLLAGGSGNFPRGASVPWPWQPDYSVAQVLRVVIGGDAASFDEDQARAFFERPWQLSSQSDRMGARLEGEPLVPPQRQWSQGVVSGAIQVPPDGQPIILMADRQTMGGYPILGWVHSLDLGRLAQCPANQMLRFTVMSLDDSQDELRAFYSFFGR
ncbi:5-oxoprolinase subunit C family protein [Metapseudomonas resinovorans]|uniref:5-oxoprolinase subunit C family protein n=1 Tax=Metapseudomonas resinovorans TaxID=53412 RepID=UPI000412EFF8|nr:biotin-dependent carboxyltransferase family protein [Pseudomonas resinovorans]MDE3738407.1 biotin-dependent carboxyltransferase family protein [Pseudomonas resinovorans]